MIFPNQGLVESILKKLFKRFPRYYEYDRDLFADLLPEYNDQNEIKKHLAYLFGEKFIDYQEIIACDVLEYWYIKITNDGIKHLNFL